MVYNQAGAGKDIKEVLPPPDFSHYLDWFWEVRDLCGGVDNPIRMGIIEEWQRHSGIALQRWERDALFAMDRAFRRGYSDVLKWHMKRPQMKLNDTDKNRVGKNGRHSRARV